MYVCVCIYIYIYVHTHIRQRVLARPGSFVAAPGALRQATLMQGQQVQPLYIYIYIYICISLSIYIYIYTYTFCLCASEGGVSSPPRAARRARRDLLIRRERQESLRQFMIAVVHFNAELVFRQNIKALRLCLDAEVEAC